jgi:DNA topoisomerase IB
MPEQTMQKFYNDIQETWNRFVTYWHSADQIGERHRSVSSKYILEKSKAAYVTMYFASLFRVSAGGKRSHSALARRGLDRLKEENNARHRQILMA